MASHSIFRIVLIVLSAVAFVALLLLHPPVAAGLYPKLYTNESFSNIYNTSVTMGDWSYITTTSLVIVYQLLLVVYLVVNIFRKSGGISKKYVYTVQGVVPPVFLITYPIGLLGYMAWNLTYFSGQVGASLIVIIPTVAIIVGEGAALRDHKEHFLDMIKAGLFVDVVLVKVIVHNGVAILDAWLSLLLFLDLGAVLTYTAGIDSTTSGIAVMCLIGLGIIGASIIELTVFRDFATFMVSQYIGYILMLAGIITQNPITAPPTVMAIAFLALSVIFLIVKLVLMGLEVRKLLKSNPLSALTG